MKTSLKLSALILFAIAAINCSGGVHVQDLKTRQLENPLAVDRPVFSWKTVSSENGFRQTAYEIEVASSEKRLTSGKADVWQSGVVLSDKQFGVEMPSDGLSYGTRYCWRVRVRGEHGRAGQWSGPAYFSTGPTTADWKADWITADRDSSRTAPFFRKHFQVSADANEIRSAVVYLCGLGCSDLYLNGTLVDPGRILDPAQTNYEHYAFYSAFDVSGLLVPGQNTVGVLLGDGWYNQDLVWGPGFTYGQPILTLQMEIGYEDGTRETVCTDTSWEWTGSPLLTSNIYAGEVYDARRTARFQEMQNSREGWNKAIKASGTIPKKLFPQRIEPIRMQEEYTGVDIRQDPAGNWIFDFCVNIAGIPKIKVCQPAGTRLKMRMGEILAPDGSIDFSSTGVAATGVFQTEEYICSGDGVEEWSPRFTYHGFRYLELSGAVSVPDASWIKAVAVHTDVNPTGYFESSDPTMNRLHDMAVRTLKGNLHGLPTDCPQREKCGWLGDAHAIAPFANCNFGMYNFWMKYLEDIRSGGSSFVAGDLHHKFGNREFYHADKAAGIPYMIAPGRRLCGVASPDWGTAIVQIPWQVYLYYGSTEPLEKYYDGMKQWVEYMESISVEHIIPFGLGDWCPPGGNSRIDCPVELSSTAFHYIDASILRETAGILGHRDDSIRFGDLCASIKTAFNEKFFDRPSGSYGSHTANAMALDAGLVPEGGEKAVSDAIARDMNRKYDGFIHTGIFGLGRIAPALSRHGNPAAAYGIFTKTGENSFPFMWENADATTLWEVLPVSSLSRDACLNGGSSLSHPMQGVYDNWFYEDVAGIKPDPRHPGFKRTVFEPRMTDHLEWAEARVETPYGEVGSRWKNNGRELEWTITIPANSDGLVVLPAQGTVSVNGKNISECRDITLAEGGGKSYLFPSGCYTIAIRR